MVKQEIRGLCNGLKTDSIRVKPIGPAI
jgi:hypothetical protein